MNGYLNFRWEKDLCRNVKIHFIVILCFVGCSNPQKNSGRPIISAEYISQNYNTYHNIRQSAIDSVSSWSNDSLAVSISYFFDGYWTIDSTLLFNEDSSRMFTVLLRSDTVSKNSEMDCIDHFAGAKIKGKWYFFIMGTMLALPRELYKYNIYEPMTLEQISYIANKEILSVGIRRLNDGRYVTDEAFMERQFFDQEYIDEKFGGERRNMDTMLLNRIAGKFKYKLDTAEIAKIKKSMAESVRPELPPQTWWDKTFNRKLFDE